MSSRDEWGWQECHDEKITVALCAGMVAHAALDLSKSDPMLWGLMMKQFELHLLRFRAAVDGKDVTKCAF